MEKASRNDIMKMLHESPISESDFEPREGQRELLCSNINSLRCPSLREEQAYISQETVNSLVELGNVLKSIRKRLFAEGYAIRDGKMIKL